MKSQIKRGQSNIRDKHFFSKETAGSPTYPLQHCHRSSLRSSQEGTWISQARKYKLCLPVTFQHSGFINLAPYSAVPKALQTAPQCCASA